MTALILNRSPYAREGGAAGQRELLYGNIGTKETNYAEIRKSVRIKLMLGTTYVVLTNRLQVPLKIIDT